MIVIGLASLVLDDITRIRTLKQKETCFIYLGRTDEIEVNKKFILLACGLSSRVVLCVTEDFLSDKESFNALNDLDGIYGISVCLNRQFQGNKNDLTQQEDILARFKKIQSKLKKNILIIPEVSLEGNVESLDGLGVDLMNLATVGCPWITLAVQGPPVEGKIKKLRECFNYLEMRGFPEIDIYFSFNNPDNLSWMYKAECYFSGPSVVHMDISNKCTHSCLFCGLYSPLVIEDEKQKAGGQLPKDLINFMSSQIPFEKATELIDSLPLIAQHIQFGGAGDPFTHPRVLELLTLARNKGIWVEVLTNMEYFKEEDLRLLTKLGSHNYFGIHIIANLAAATAEIYVRVRPRQTQQTFEKVMSNVKKLRSLREENQGIGVSVTFMSVMNRFNYSEACQMVELASEVGADKIWFKPLEIYHPEHVHLLPPESEKIEYAKSLHRALQIAEKLNVQILQKETIEPWLEALSQKSDSQKQNDDKKSKSYSVMNGGFPNDLYKNISCRIGLNYIRFQVDGEVKSCCIAKYPIGEIRTQTWRKVWRSTAYAAFRNKMKRIATDHFHLTDPEFKFCQNCSHIPNNVEIDRLLRQ